MVMCAGGVDPLKNFAISTSVGSGVPGWFGSSVTTMRGER